MMMSTFFVLDQQMNFIALADWNKRPHGHIILISSRLLTETEITKWLEESTKINWNSLQNNFIRGVMFVSSTVDRGFEILSGQPTHFIIGTPRKRLIKYWYSVSQYLSDIRNIYIKADRFPLMMLTAADKERKQIQF
jgi:hypothetical protein